MSTISFPMIFQLPLILKLHDTNLHPKDNNIDIYSEVSSFIHI